MSFSATRLTCFALISALEQDLRAHIENAAPEPSPIELLGEERAARVQSRRTREQGGRPAGTLAPLLPYLDFADSYEVLNKVRGHLPDEFSTHLAAFAQRMTKLVGIRNRVAHSRPMEIDDLPFLLDSAAALLDGDREQWPELAQANALLTADPSHVLGLKVSLPSDPDRAPQNNLPVPDFDETGFFGRRTQIQRINKAIKGAYPVVSILGDGGIGKTSLALKVAYELLDDPSSNFDAFVWVTAKATVLTTSEIRRISDAVQDSLGLFAAAAAELGANAEGNPIDELLSYLEHFKVLLFLDNLETVLDQRLRDFLLDLPLGSKVVVTSRIGLGIENPVQMEPLAEDESANLLRALARIRDVPALRQARQDDVLALARKMNGHPAYIKWFVSGVQAGKRPEELLSDNALLLDFCMSNVYDYLGTDSRAVLRSLQALPGPKTQAELAFINEFTAKGIQAALLELITTNFAQMRGLSSGQSLETTYELSEFAKDYLDTSHPVSPEEQDWLLNQRARLMELGDVLRAENSASPYNPQTVDVRGAGDFHVAKLLRDAMRAALAEGNTDLALQLCREAQVLSPAYQESWRVEAFVQDVRGDFTSALNAYERASDLAPHSSPLNFFYGEFLVRSGISIQRGLSRLQAAVNPEDPQEIVLVTIAFAQFALGDWRSAIAAGRHAACLRGARSRDAFSALLTALRAAHSGACAAIDAESESEALELLEAALETAEAVPVEMVRAEAVDWLIQLRRTTDQLAGRSSENYIARKAGEFSSRYTERLRQADPMNLERRLGTVRSVIADKFFGFVRSGKTDYFFHLRDMANEQDWERLAEGSTVAFSPLANLKGPRAADARLLA